MTMIQPLIGPRLKLSRANRHIRDLESVFEAFVCEYPHRLGVQENPDGSCTVFAQFERPLPNEIATIIGDAVHNLRTALDHLACDMIRKSGEEPTRHSGFPIYETKRDFEAGLRSKLKGASEKFVDFVKAQRPYRDEGGNLWINDLAALDNDDKHIILTPTAAVSEVTNVTISDEMENAILIRSLKTRGHGQADIAHFGGGGKVSLKADSDATLSIEFGQGSRFEGEHVIRTLHMFRTGVDDIIRAAGHLFG